MEMAYNEYINEYYAKIGKSLLFCTVAGICAWVVQP